MDNEFGKVCPDCGQPMIMKRRVGSPGLWTEHLCPDKKAALDESARLQSVWAHRDGRWQYVRDDSINLPKPLSEPVQPTFQLNE